MLGKEAVPSSKVMEQEARKAATQVKAEIAQGLLDAQDRVEVEERMRDLMATAIPMPGGESDATSMLKGLTGGEGWNPMDDSDSISIFFDQMQAAMERALDQVIYKKASTGADCYFYEESKGKWFYKLQQYPYGQTPDYDTFGPFGTFKQAYDHLSDNHANPGGFNINALPGCPHDMVEDGWCNRCGASIKQAAGTVPLGGEILRRKPSNTDGWEIVLVKVQQGASPYVTWAHDPASGEFQSGHYFQDLHDAEVDFKNRDAQGGSPQQPMVTSVRGALNPTGIAPKDWKPYCPECSAHVEEKEGKLWCATCKKVVPREKAVSLASKKVAYGQPGEQGADDWLAQCRECKQRFWASEGGIQHFKEYEGASEQPYSSCPSCGAGSEHWDDLGDGTLVEAMVKGAGSAGRGDYITDFGKSQDLFQEDGSVNMTIPRYGVWVKGDVMETSDDLEALQQKWGPGLRVIPLGTKQAMVKEAKESLARIELWCGQGDSEDAPGIQEALDRYRRAGEVAKANGVGTNFSGPWQEKTGDSFYCDGYLYPPLSKLEAVLAGLDAAGVEYDNIDLPVALEGTEFGNRIKVLAGSAVSVNFGGWVVNREAMVKEAYGVNVGGRQFEVVPTYGDNLALTHYEIKDELGRSVLQIPTDRQLTQPEIEQAIFQQVSITGGKEAAYALPQVTLRGKTWIVDARLHQLRTTDTMDILDLDDLTEEEFDLVWAVAGEDIKRALGTGPCPKCKEPMGNHGDNGECPSVGQCPSCGKQYTASESPSGQCVDCGTTLTKEAALNKEAASNKALAQAFAEGASKGRSNNMFIEGTTIYSYGYHWPLATWSQDDQGNPVVYLNANRRSVTTTNHTSYVRQALLSAGVNVVESLQIKDNIVMPPAPGEMEERADQERERKRDNQRRYRQRRKELEQGQQDDALLQELNAPPAPQAPPKPSPQRAPEYSERWFDRHLEDAPQSPSQVPGMGTKERQQALDRLLDQYNQTQDPDDRAMLESKMRELRASLAGWLKTAEEYCPGCRLPKRMYHEDDPDKKMLCGNRRCRLFGNQKADETEDEFLGRMTQGAPKHNFLQDEVLLVNEDFKANSENIGGQGIGWGAKGHPYSIIPAGTKIVLEQVYPNIVHFAPVNESGDQYDRPSFPTLGPKGEDVGQSYKFSIAPAKLAKFTTQVSPGKEPPPDPDAVRSNGETDGLYSKWSQSDATDSMVEGYKEQLREGLPADIRQEKGKDGKSYSISHGWDKHPWMLEGTAFAESYAASPDPDEWFKNIEMQGHMGKLDEALREKAYNDQDGYDWAWESMTEDLSNLMETVNPGKPKLWRVNMRGFGWMKEDADGTVQADTGVELLRKILPNTDCSFRIYKEGRGIKINNAHHDAPMGGEMYYITPFDAEPPNPPETPRQQQLMVAPEMADELNEYHERRKEQNRPKEVQTDPEDLQQHDESGRPIKYRVDRTLAPTDLSEVKSVDPDAEFDRLIQQRDSGEITPEQFEEKSRRLFGSLRRSGINFELVAIDPRRLEGYEANQDQGNVERLVAAYQNGDPVPPIVAAGTAESAKILDGHHRMLAAQALGLKAIPVFLVSEADYAALKEQDWPDLDIADQVYQEDYEKHGRHRTAGSKTIECCGQPLELTSSWANSCPSCGTEYNGAGQRLAPRSQWGEETGETFYSGEPDPGPDDLDREGANRQAEDWGFTDHPMLGGNDVIKGVAVYDNGGKSFDRFTVLIGNDFFGMSENALQPNGFNQYIGSLGEGGPELGDHLGFPKALEDLPPEVQKAVKQRMKEQGA